MKFEDFRTAQSIKDKQRELMRTKSNILNDKDVTMTYLQYKPIKDAICKVLTDEVDRLERKFDDV